MFKQFKKWFSYIVCLFTPKAIVEAINAAADEDELDELVNDKAGLKW